MTSSQLRRDHIEEITVDGDKKEGGSNDELKVQQPKREDVVSTEVVPDLEKDEEITSNTPKGEDVVTTEVVPASEDEEITIEKSQLTETEEGDQTN
ncbi:hypothetical protein TYRP_010202 [Tyrophagus putrescentiae]|nr:hypothetical protein TYRP_010202 [Tyrophagus putrescentiae]